MLRLFWFFSLTLLVSQIGWAEIVTTDDKNNLVRITKPASRIISLAPDITEILFAIGAGDKVKAVISGSDYPEQAQKLPMIGTYRGLDLEQIVRLKPDLVVVWSNGFLRQLKVLRKMGIPIYITHPVQAEDVARTMKRLGLLTGLEAVAQKRASDYLDQIEDLRIKYSSQKKIAVYYQVGGYSLLTINHQSWINQAIELCGGMNIFAEAASITPEITWESLLKRRPKIILSDTSIKNLESRFKSWAMIPAVKNNQLYHVEADWIDRAGPRLIQGMRQICTYIAQARQVYQ